ncbi:MAG: methyltransferase domain-containing protein [Acidobacteriia bacterium]|nr:methyltransferase domain-containing protein [Terriglobia bacterium]
MKNPIRESMDNTVDRSVATALRRKRFVLFRDLIERLDPPIRILDVGGTEQFWDMMKFEASEQVQITLLNTFPAGVSRPHMQSAVGDARNLSRFADHEFDVVFSNSVIEHVGSIDDQRKMAGEIRRVGKSYFVQTPNRGFPLEPHFMFPFFQFLPVSFRAKLLQKFNLGWIARVPDYPSAKLAVQTIRLLTRRDLEQMFPEAEIFEERFLGLTKSFVAYSGWGKQEGQPGRGAKA